jgi:two-component system response regulator GlrR
MTKEKSRGRGQPLKLLIFDCTAGSALLAAFVCELASASEISHSVISGLEVVRDSSFAMIDVIAIAVSNLHHSRGLQLLSSLRAKAVQNPVLIVTDVDSGPHLVDFVRRDASDLLLFPFRNGEVLSRIRTSTEQKSEEKQAAVKLSGELGLRRSIVGNCETMQLALEKAKRFAQCDATVLINGETGTGKEVFARAIHELGRRSSGPFIPINCGALPSDLVENELFGHEAGAFTGARGAYKGCIEQASGGTLFLDEIDSLPLQAQTKILRFLQEHEFRPLGSSSTRRSDVRVVSAANTDLSRAVSSRLFRQDLFFRLNVLNLTLPPLRDRGDDILLLARHLLNRHAAEVSKVDCSFTPSATRKLRSYEWPGNVRELDNVIHRALLLSDSDITEDDLDLPNRGNKIGELSFKSQKAAAIRAFEQKFLRDLLEQFGGNVSQAAAAASKERRTFFQLLKKHQIATGQSSSIRLRIH